MENAFLRWPTGPGAALWSAPAEFGMDADDCMHHNVSGSRHWMLLANLFSMNCSVPICTGYTLIYYMCVKMYAPILYSAYMQCVYAHIVHTGCNFLLPIMFNQYPAWSSKSGSSGSSIAIASSTTMSPGCSCGPSRALKPMTLSNSFADCPGVHVLSQHVWY